MPFTGFSGSRRGELQSPSRQPQALYFPRAAFRKESHLKGMHLLDSGPKSLPWLFCMNGAL